jgi:hypothetical protein
LFEDQGTDGALETEYKKHKPAKESLKNKLHP